MKKIDTIEQWDMLSSAMHEQGWKLWQSQYDWDSPKGFHAWFGKGGKKDVEVVTHSKDVQREIVGYNSRK